MLNLHVMDQTPFATFSEASRSTLKYLRNKYGYGAWMMTRKNEDEWVILQVEGDGYQIDELTVINWNDSMCSRMVKGEGPRWAPDVDDIPSYVEAPIYRAEKIKSYVGIPVCFANGDLFGTLCAIDTVPSGRIPADGKETVELVSKLLSSLLQLELQNIALSRKQISFLPEPLKDNQTGFLNRLGWSIYLEKEESNVRAVGTPLYIVALDVTLPGKEKGDEYQQLLTIVVSIINSSVTDEGVIARLSDNIFTILLANSSNKQFKLCLDTLERELTEASVVAQIGSEKHNYTDKLDATVMSAIKSARSS
ncbi:MULTISPECIES: diguanylate cyclase domain-containing protein [Vibrio]|uniref:diguanylate cyclase domain-containing protein n=1 Tax=Vibrio TaxID=662 RepID=UPI0020759392|nr:MULTISPECIES: diguanylate cyclase [Vibrio]USD33481.1 diguanylate cyclase [Vibrio sp. SCSIO 43186]USD46550.1 diguanylate cyclase [Vibrio sp. SCSIO 43145]USD70605.1 diguanylate cyclase [Vibrio sp. SCSIO 43139]